jgi:transposase
VVVGHGTRLFSDTGPDTALDLVDSRATAKGVTIQLYRAHRPPAVRNVHRRLEAHEEVVLDTEVKALSKQIKTLVDQAAPELVSLFGVGTELAGQFLVTAGDNSCRIRNEAAFAKLCGAAPQPASSGKTTGRHRLSRSGDRAANSALYIVAITRIRHHQPSREYFARRTEEGLSKREIIRCLKRYIAREIYAALPEVVAARLLLPAA